MFFLGVFSSLYVQSGFSLSPLPSLSLLPSSPEPPGSSLCYRELFCPSAQRIRQQQSVFFWSQRPPPLPAGSTKTWSHRQPASSHHRPHEGKDVCVCVCVCLWAAQSQFNYMFRVCESTVTSRLSHTNCWGYLQYIDVHIKKTFKTPDSFWSRLHLSLKQLPNFRIQWASLHCRLKL